MNRLDGKRALVTGASSGVGLAVARDLVRLGADVVVHARSRERGEAAQQRIARETGVERTDLLLADFADLFAVCAAGKEYARRFDRLDILVLNAGAIFPERVLTEHGNELTFQVNHLAHFMLWRVIQPLLWASAPSRIIHVSSGAHVHARSGIDFSDLTFERRWTPFSAYARSKLANIMFCYEQARRLAPLGITSNAVHPGLVRTGFGRDWHGLSGEGMRLATALFGRTPEAGADTVVWLAASPDLEGVTGGYYYERRLKRTSSASHDRGAQERLWSESCERAGCGGLVTPPLVVL